MCVGEEGKKGQKRTRPGGEHLYTEHGASRLRTRPWDVGHGNMGRGTGGRGLDCQARK